MQAQVIIIFAIGIFFNALANILIKASSLSALPKDDSNPIGGLIQSLFNPVFISGLASFGLALVAYKYVLGKGLKLSLAYPVFTSTGFIIVLTASALIFKEKLTWIQWAGIVLIVTGVWLTASQMFDAGS